MSATRQRFGAALFFVSVVAVAVGQSEPWYCGTTPEMGENIRRALSPEKQPAYNACCRAHDLCYDRHQGRQFCDDTFCDCLNRAAQPVDVWAAADNLRHAMEAATMCAAVRLYGEQPYQRAG